MRIINFNLFPIVVLENLPFSMANKWSQIYSEKDVDDDNSLQWVSQKWKINLKTLLERERHITFVLEYLCV